IKKNKISKKDVSMQSIRSWLEQHPGENEGILNKNPSYVFFNILKNGEPLGTQNVPLTPRRSLAVDTHYIPLGAPVWLDTDAPSLQTKNITPFRRLLIAQDSGGAIHGIVRGDVFWGADNNAEYAAGYMKSKGQYWVLLPRSAAM